MSAEQRRKSRLRKANPHTYPDTYNIPRKAFPRLVKKCRRPARWLSTMVFTTPAGKLRFPLQLRSVCEEVKITVEISPFHSFIGVHAQDYVLERG
jgi:hypothetical protein